MDPVENQQHDDNNEPEQEETFTLDELIHHEESLQADCSSVLGASDRKNCSYPKGYVKRQALYACLYCTNPNSPDFEPAGFCLACSYKCHDHGGEEQIVELYTKRNFRCDCGNKKYSGNPCQLIPEKDDTNPDNKYNQNFMGLYCTCHRPYPDPDNENDNETETEDPMSQCMICEDWYHESHVFPGQTVSISEQDIEPTEMVCQDCMNKCSFLKHYENLTLKVTKPDEVIDVGVSQDSGIAGSTSNGNQDSNASSSVNSKETNDKTPEADSHETKEESGKCYLIQNKSTLTGSALFLNGWRKDLCKCADCLKLYSDLNVDFIIDEDDTLVKYENDGKEKLETEKREEEAEVDKMLANLGHVGQIELIHGVNEFKEAFHEFLKGFTDGRVVTAADVQEFFAEFKESKRRRLENGNSVPTHFCR